MIGSLFVCHLFFFFSCVFPGFDLVLLVLPPSLTLTHRVALERTSRMCMSWLPHTRLYHPFSHDGSDSAYVTTRRHPSVPVRYRYHRHRHRACSFLRHLLLPPVSLVLIAPAGFTSTPPIHSFRAENSPPLFSTLWPNSTISYWLTHLFIFYPDNCIFVHASFHHHSNTCHAIYSCDQWSRRMWCAYCYLAQMDRIPSPLSRSPYTRLAVPQLSRSFHDADLSTYFSIDRVHDLLDRLPTTPLHPPRPSALSSHRPCAPSASLLSSLIRPL